MGAIFEPIKKSGAPQREQTYSTEERSRNLAQFLGALLCWRRYVESPRQRSPGLGRIIYRSKLSTCFQFYHYNYYYCFIFLV